MLRLQKCPEGGLTVFDAGYFVGRTFGVEVAVLGCRTLSHHKFAICSLQVLVAHYALLVACLPCPLSLACIRLAVRSTANFTDSCDSRMYRRVVA